MLQGNKKKGNEEIKIGNCCCFGIEDVEKRKLQREERCVYLYGVDTWTALYSDRYICAEITTFSLSGCSTATCQDRGGAWSRRNAMAEPE
jgi:hypothetical protein